MQCFSSSTQAIRISRTDRGKLTLGKNQFKVRYFGCYGMFSLSYYWLHSESSSEFSAVKICFSIFWISIASVKYFWSWEKKLIPKFKGTTFLWWAKNFKVKFEYANEIMNVAVSIHTYLTCEFDWNDSNAHPYSKVAVHNMLLHKLKSR